MSKSSLEKRSSAPLKEKGQYALAFSIITVMLYMAGFPIFFLFFIGLLSYFVWKVFSGESRSESRRIFEFYLSANEILRENERRWFGFEIQEAVARGEAITRSMASAPPLVYFALGALYQKLGDYNSASKNLARVVEEASFSEAAMVYPTREFREYVRMLRKIERSPAEAPMTASAVRSLERMRKNKAASLLTESRTLATDQGQPALGDGHNDNAEQGDASYPQDVSNHENGFVHFVSTEAESGGIKKTDGPKRTVRERVSNDKEQPDRKTISEVLRDIYDENVH